MNHPTPLFIIGVSLFIACQEQPKEKSPAIWQQLERDLTHWRCHLEELNEEAASLWDTVVYELDEVLPANMPADERSNMLKVRNSNLIRMFEVYPQLSDSVHQLVDEAGQRDELLAHQLKAAHDSVVHYEKLAQDYLLTVHEKDPIDAQHLNKRLSKITCD